MGLPAGERRQKIRSQTTLRRQRIQYRFTVSGDQGSPAKVDKNPDLCARRQFRGVAFVRPHSTGRSIPY